MLLDVLLFIGIIISVLQIVFLGFRLFSKSQRFTEVLVVCSISLIIFGILSYFYFGFPLDEGTVSLAQIPAYQFRFGVAIYFMVIGFLFPFAKVLGIL